MKFCGIKQYKFRYINNEQLLRNLSWSFVGIILASVIIFSINIIFGRILEKKEDTFAIEFEQITNIICTKDTHAS